MRRSILLALLLLLAALPAACGGGREYQAPEHGHEKWRVEWDNCVWDATHRRQDDGSYAAVEVPEDKLEPLAHQCMENKGYKLKTREDAKKSGWLWW